jgi:crotonobetainyl-CoA:carnitine CoA-transferase CaiB-like acyl-CoA transferase
VSGPFAGLWQAAQARLDALKAGPTAEQIAVARAQVAELIGARMRRWCATRSTSEAIEILGAAKIPCAPVLSAQQALDHPQVQALGLHQPLDYPGLPAPAPVGRVPLSMSVTKGGIRHRAPVLGEHTDRILAELGYGASEIADLRLRQIV